MLINFVQIIKLDAVSYTLESVYINPKHIVLLKENKQCRDALTEGKINLPIDKHAEFTTIFISENSSTKEIVVVGSPSSVESKLFNKQKQILRG